MTIEFIGDPAVTPVIVIKPYVKGWDGYLNGRCVSRPRPGKDGEALIFKDGCFHRIVYYWMPWDGHGSYSGYATKTILDTAEPTDEQLSEYLAECPSWELTLEVASAYHDRKLSEAAIENCRKALQQKAEAEDLQKRKMAREEWLKSLPEKVGDFTLANGEVYDEIGNYLFSLPQNPVDDIEAWIDKEFQEFLEYDA